MISQNGLAEVVSRKRYFWMAAALGCLFCVATNLPWQLDDYDQGKQAFTSYEMVKEGHWLYQHTPRGRVATKPPLVGWISAGLFEMTRSWDTAWRLPSFAAAAALALCLARAGTSAYGVTGGLVALGAFTLNLLTPRLATLVRTDMPLALVLFLTGLLMWQHIRINSSWSARDRMWLFVLLTVGMLIKGPIVYAFLLPGLIYFQWWRRRAGGASAWSGWWPWVASLAVFLLWAIAGIRWVPGFYEQVVLREFIGRFGETVHRPQPLYFYLPHLLHKFAPWSLLLMAFAWMGWRARRKAGSASTPTLNPDMMWLLCWSLGGLFVMSCVPSKRVDRIFPVVPPLCLLLAAQIGQFRSNEPRLAQVKCWLAGALTFAVLFTGGYTVFKVTSGYRGRVDALVEFGRLVREQAASHHWRYEVVSGSDEPLILYLDKTSFTERDAAVASWNSGGLDALVVPAEDSADYLHDLHDSVITQLKSAKRIEQRNTYVLFVRAGRGD